MHGSSTNHALTRRRSVVMGAEARLWTMRPYCNVPIIDPALE